MTSTAGGSGRVPVVEDTTVSEGAEGPEQMETEVEDVAEGDAEGWCVY